MAQVLQEGLSALTRDAASLPAYVKSWATSHGSASLQARMAAAEALVLLDQSATSKEAALKLLISAPVAAQPAEHPHEECVALHHALLPPPAAYKTATPATAPAQAANGTATTSSAAASPAIVAAARPPLGLLSDADAASQWASACVQAYPYSAYFGGSKKITFEDAVDFDKLTEAFGKLAF